LIRHDGLAVSFALKEDIDFVVEGIMNSDKSGTKNNSYSQLFDLSEDELKGILIDILNEDIPNSEFNLSSYLILKENDNPMGVLAMWNEGVGHLSNIQIKSNVLSYYIGRDKWAKAISKLQAVSEIEIKREPNTLQIESVYIRNEYRGRKLLKKIINFGQEYFSFQNEIIPDKMQVISLIENKIAHKAFINLGFQERYKTISRNDEILSFYPGKGKVLFEKLI